jgi:hypothetical protein
MTVDAGTEFARQLDVMVDAGYPALARLAPAEFAAVIEPLRECVGSRQRQGIAGTTNDAAPWLIVVGPRLIAAEDLIPLVRLPGGAAPGIVDRNHGGDPLAQYVPLPELAVPDALAYILFDVDRGDEFRGVRPRDAVPVIRGRGRTPLTIHEGLALAMQHPASLERNRCYMLAGSRRGDKRVPALWISANAPKLGWCWDGNLHTWLGIASAGSRRAAEGASDAPS